MSAVEHIATLEAKREKIKEKIRTAYLHHVPDHKVTDLKKLKLSLKDEIEAIRRKSA